MQLEPEKKQQQETQKQLKKKPIGQSQSDPRTAISNDSKRNFWLTALTAAAIAFGAWSFYPTAAPDSDNLTDTEKTQILEEYNAIKSFEVDRITEPTEIEQAIKSMKLSPDQETILEQKVQNGDLDMAWIQAWDNMSEDGDVLKFESQSYTVTTTLMNKPVFFALPLAKGSNYVKVTGIHDGGGGITASVITSSGAKSVPVINQGESYTLPIK